MKRMIAQRLLALLASLALLAACGAPAPGQPSPSAPEPTANVAPAPETAAAEVVPTAEAVDGQTSAPAAPAAVCPVATADTALYVSNENGLCFLYPLDLQLRPEPRFPQDAVQLTGAPLDPTAMESFALNLSVSYNGPADGLDSAAYAAAWVAYNAPGMDLPQTSVAIGGQPAVVIDNLPGMMMNPRGAFVVANDVKYQLMLLPQPQDVPELADAATRAWDTITESMVFFPPARTDTVVRSADVCPTATADTKLLVSEVGGYCLLYPADFELDPTVSYHALVGGPELGPFGDFPSVRVSLGIGGAYPLVDMTPEQILQPGPENIDPASVTNTTIGGYPAVTSDFVTGPWLQRNANILVDDRYYTFASGPWDPTLFPHALPDMERLWDTVVQSIAFFAPWR